MDTKILLVRPLKLQRSVVGYVAGGDSTLVDPEGSLVLRH
jgi:hypothetical protein